MDSITIIIEYRTVKYGLVILPSSTIRQVKQKIAVGKQAVTNGQENLDIALSNQVLAFNSVILDNDRTVAYYGITSSSELVLIENAFQNSIVNKDTELLELNSWLDFLNSDFETGSRFVRDADYITSKIHELETIPYGLDCIDNALIYIRKCADSAGKLFSLASALSQKYSFLQSECNRFYGIVEETKKTQIELQKSALAIPSSFLGIENLHLHVGSEEEVRTLRARSQPAASTVQESAREETQPVMRDTIEEYVWWLDNEREEIASGSTTIENTPDTRTRERFLPSGSMISLLGPGEEDEECQEIRRSIENEVSRMPIYYASAIVAAEGEERSGDGGESAVVSVHTKEASMTVLKRIEEHPEEFKTLRVLDFSCCRCACR